MKKLTLADLNIKRHPKDEPRNYKHFGVFLNKFESDALDEVAEFQGKSKNMVIRGLIIEKAIKEDLLK